MVYKLRPVLFCFTILLSLAVKSSAGTTNHENEAADGAKYSSYIQVVLNYLNSNPNKVYEYKRGTVLNAQEKANDITEIVIDVEVTCVNKYPGLPCTEQSLTCHGFVGKSQETNEYHVLSDVSCSPKIEISIEDVDDDKLVPPVPRASFANTNIELSNEAVSGEQGADFVAVRRDSLPCLGCPFDLNIEAEGVEELLHTALKHLESERNQRHKILKVLRLQEQVIAGVKYILLIEVAPTVCDKDADISQPCPQLDSLPSVTCQVTFIHQPWINKNKHITSNNCTVSQEYSLKHTRDERDDLDNEIDANVGYSNKIKHDNGFRDETPFYNNIAESGNLEPDMSPGRLADLESQILFGDDLHIVKPSSEKPIVGMVTVESERPSSVYFPQTLSVPEDQPIITDLGAGTTEDARSPVIDNSYQNPLVYSFLPVVDEKEPVTILEQNIPNEQVQGRADINNQEYAFDFQTTEQSVNAEATVTPSDDLSDEEAQVIKKDSTTENQIVIDKILADPYLEKITLFEAMLPELNHFNGKTDEKSVSTQEEQSLRVNRACPLPYLDFPENDLKRNKDERNRDEHPENAAVIVKRELEKPSNGKSSESEEKSNESNSDEDKGRATTLTPEIRVKRSSSNKDDDKSNSDSKSAESEEKGNKEAKSKSSSEKKSKEEKESISNESGSNEERGITTTISSELRIKRSSRNNKNDEKNDSSSSTSGSSEEDNKNNEKHEDRDRRTNEVELQKKKDDSSSSSSSSEEGDNKKDEPSPKLEIQLKKKYDVADHDSSSSSESDEVINKEEKQKRSVGQMEKITPDEKVIVRDLADFAAATLDKIDEDNHKRVILQILGAKKLKLDGIYYQIILRLGISHCLEHDHDESCREKLLTNLTKVCKVQVHVDDDLSNPKVVKSQCQNIKKDENDRNRTNYSRYKRTVGVVGGPSDLPLDDPRIKKYTKEPLSYLDSKSSHEKKFKILKVLSATSQVVAGVKYIINAEISLSSCDKDDPKPQEECDQLENAKPKLCKIEVWDRPWLNKKITTIECDKESYNFESTSNRKKRSLGSESELEVGVSDYVNELLETGLSHFSAQNQKKYKVKKVMSVKKQLVAGFLWTVQAEIVGMQCETEICESDGTSKVCEFKIWDKPWLIRRTNMTCDESDQVYTFLSFKKPSKNVNKAFLENKASEFIDIGLEYLNKKSLFNTRYILNSISFVSAPVNDDGIWHIHAEIARSDCVKQYEDKNCKPIGAGIHCNFTVVENNNKNASKQMSFTCENDDNIYSFYPDVELKGAMDYDYTLQAFKDYVLKHNKIYENTIEYNYRFKVFKDNLKTIQLLNKNDQGTGQYGVTRFADLTQKEFSQSHGLRMDLHSENNIPFMQAKIPQVNIPVEFDWRKKNAVTEIKNQGLCGSCWAFSVTGNVEGQYAIKYGNLTEFSEQELVDCDKVDEGCNGGLMDNAYRVIEKMGGLETETDYPYEGADEKCHFDKAKVRVELSGALNISHNETDMAKWLVANGPISIAINANAMQFYMGGVSHPYKVLCNPKNLDHGVLIVGYGIHQYPLFKKSLPYWIVKNSWGTSWGEQGYYRVYRGDGTCGVNQTPSSAVVA